MSVARAAEELWREQMTDVWPMSEVRVGKLPTATGHNQMKARERSSHHRATERDANADKLDCWTQAIISSVI